jgi:alkylhydroperoxidase/carboxymuconolactone decarboxylase family protein YurZ
MTQDPDRLPSGAAAVARDHPGVWAAYAALGRACAMAGPLDRRTVRLVKLALALGAQSEGAVHSHTRRALSEGLSTDELRHVALLAIPTLGLPQAVKGLTWIGDLTPDGQDEGQGGRPDGGQEDAARTGPGIRA